MESLPLQIYAAFSTIGCATAVAKKWKIHGRVLETIVALEEDKMASFAVRNFLLMLLVIVVYAILQNTLRPLKSRLIKDSLAQVLSLLFATMFALVDSKSSTESLDPFELLFASGILYTLFIIYNGIDEFTVRPNLPSKAQHMRLISLQVILLFLSIYLYANEFHPIKNLLFVSLYFSSISKAIHGLLIHFTFICDRDEYGNSISTKIMNENIGLVMAFIDLFVDLELLYIDYVYVTKGISQRRMIGFVSSGRAIFESLKKRSRRIKMSKLLDSKFENPTPEKLENEPTCMICRDEMHLDDSKMLMCGHCFHRDCLLRYFIDKDKCPYCGEKIEIPEEIQIHDEEQIPEHFDEPEPVEVAAPENEAEEEEEMFLPDHETRSFSFEELNSM